MANLAAFIAFVLPCSNAFTTPITPGVDTTASRVCLRADTKPGILDLRFSKVGRFDNQKEAPILPTFPVCNMIDNDYKKLSRQTLADSVRRDLSFAPSSDTDQYLVASNVKPPLYPGDEGFWDQLDEVVNQQINRRAGVNPSNVATWPELWVKRTNSKLYPWGEKNARSSLTLQQVANSVRGEFSNYHQQDVIAKIAGELLERRKTAVNGEPFAVIQPKSKIDFIQLQVRMAQINSWSLEAVADTNFALKWNYGVPRPEEVAYYIHQTGEAKLKQELVGKEKIPVALIREIKEMKLTSAEDFTAYGGGSPMHPSFPAMHSAGSTCSLWVPALYKITAEQYFQLVLTDYAVAFARTVAGVHYKQDNIAGLNIGQRIIKEKLPEYVKTNYGPTSEEINKIERRLKALSFDWNEYDPEKCTIGDKTVEQFFNGLRLD